MERDENYNNDVDRCYCGIRCIKDNKEELKKLLDKINIDVTGKDFTSDKHYWLFWKEDLAYGDIWPFFLEMNKELELFLRMKP